MPKRKKETVIVDSQEALDQVLENDDITTDASDELSDQIQTLGGRRDKLTEGHAYIDANLNTLRGVFSESPSAASNALGKAVARVKAKIEELQAALLKQQQLAARTIVKRKKGQRAGDGNCYVQFINIGMGDCTAITTPHGVRILIDCGTDSTSDILLDPALKDEGVTPEEHLRGTLKAPLFLNGEDLVHLVLLTHPDADHHNKLRLLLSKVPVKIGHVYFAGTDSIEDYVGTSAYLKEVAGATAASLRKVTLREEAELSDTGDVVVTKTINDTALPSSETAGQFATEFIDNRGAMVLYYEQTASSDFKISVLAANVTGVWQGNDFVSAETDIKQADEPKLNSAGDKNKRSLMVLIECFKTVILICGDATAVTEQFAVDYFKAELSTVEYLRMGHHGSPTSSSKAFIGACNGVLTAVASTGGENTVLHGLPKQAILALHEANVLNGAPKHSIYAFNSDDQKAQLYFPDIVRKLYATGSNDTYSFAISN